MKLYYSNILISMALLIPYTLILLNIMLYFAKKLLFKDRKTNLILIIGFLFYISVIILDIQFNLMPYAPDTDIYTEILQNKKAIIDKSMGIKSFYYFSYVFKTLSFNLPIIYLVFNVLISFIGVIYIFSAYTYYSKNISVQLQRIYFVLVILYPSFLNYSISPLRESYGILFWGIFFYGFYKSKKSYLFISSVALFFLRKQFLIFICIFILTKILEREYRLNNKIKTFFFIGVGIIISLFINQIFQMIGLNISPKIMEFIRNNQIERHGEILTYPKVIWKTYYDIFKDSFYLILQFLLSPIPILYKNINQVGLFMWFDAVYLIFIYCLSLKMIFNLKKEISWKVIFLIFIILSGIYEFFITGAVRHRYPLMFMLIVLAAKNLKIILQKYKKYLC